MTKAGGKELKITKEICDKVLYLDCREETGIRRLKKSLMKLPLIKSEEDLTTDRMEEIVKKIEKKYFIHLSYIMRSVVDCEDHYSAMIKHETGTWLCTAYGKTIWECLGKTIFFMYYYVESERRKMRKRKAE